MWKSQNDLLNFKVLEVPQPTEKDYQYKTFSLDSQKVDAWNYIFFGTNFSK